MKNNKIATIIFLCLTAVTAIAGVALLISGMNSPGQTESVPFIVGVFVLLIAFVFLISALSIWAQTARQRNRRAALGSFIAQNGLENAVCLTGMYSKKGEAGKAAAKSAASAAAGIAFAALFGFGAYKIYSAGKAMEYILCDKGLFMIESCQQIHPANMIFIGKGNFPEMTCETKKQQVTLTDNATGEYFTFRITRDGGLTAEQLSARFKELLSAQPDPVPETDAQPVSPFDEFETPQPTAEENEI